MAGGVSVQSPVRVGRQMLQAFKWFKSFKTFKPSEQTYCYGIWEQRIYEEQICRLRAHVSALSS